MSDQTPFPPGLPTAGPGLSALLPQRSAGLKLILVCALALLMAIPALFVYGVVQERTLGQQQALSEVSELSGGPQSVLGPVLAVPYARAPDPDKPDRVVYAIAIAYAETGSASADVTVTERRRGIYPVPVYEADLAFEARFAAGALAGAIPQDASPIWADARLYLGVSDTRGIRESLSLTVNGAPVTPAPAPYRSVGESGYSPVPASNVVLAGAPVPGLDAAAGPLTVRARLRLSGAESLAIGPFAQDTSVSMTSNWDAPSFTGGVLPARHTADEPGTDGFTAEWRVPYLARGIPGAGAGLDLSEVTGWNARDMAVRFMRLDNPYQSVERSLKYAAMFIGFVFLAYFLFEVTGGLRAHPAQYVLVGLAQTIFYLLLLAFAERIGFDLAFLAAAVMTVTLTATYAGSVFGSRAYGGRAFIILTGIYGLVYVLMRAGGYALLAGALASFAAIALTMFLTRNVDWYGERRRTAAPA